MHNSCRGCGKEAEEGELYCPLCAASSGGIKPRKIWLFTICFSILLLVLAVIVLWSGNCCNLNFSWDEFTGKPAAMINGETVSRAELRNRFDVARRILERQYGSEIFTGETGQERLASLKREVLDRMLEELIIAQEARRMGIRITDVMVEDELQRIGREISGSGENLRNTLGEDGINQDALKSHIRNAVTFQALAKVKISQADRGVEPEAYFVNWLGQVKKTAKIVVYDSSSAVANVPAQSGGCCGSGDGGSVGGGCGGKQAGPADPELESKASSAALAEYRKKNPAEKEVVARVTDYGCHIQVDIEKAGKAIWSYSYQDGKVIDN